MSKVKVAPRKAALSKVVLSKNEGTNESEQYKVKDDISHILDRPSMYLGSLDFSFDRETRILQFLVTPDNVEVPTMVDVITQIPEAMEQIFIEALTNASDNIIRSRQQGWTNEQIGPIEISMDNTTVSIKNGGNPIPIEIHLQQNIPTPSVIFGMLRSSSNYDDTDANRITAGTNGLGIKCCNIFSSAFMVNIGDPVRKLQFRQIWNSNMSICNPYEIAEYTGPSFVEITYELDFHRFNCESYPEQMIDIIARYAADTAYNCHIPVIFNGRRFDFSSPFEYIKLFFQENLESDENLVSSLNSVIHYEWEEGVEVVNKKDGYTYAKDKNVKPLVELIMLDTPDNAKLISFVNGVWTREGGVHTDAIYKAISNDILKVINNNNSDKLGNKKGKKNETDKAKEKAADKALKSKLTLKDLKPHITIILICQLPKPVFRGQMKTYLNGPLPKISIPKKTMNKILTWNLIDRLYASVEAKLYKTMSKTDGKKRRHIGLETTIDCNEAGRENSEMCVLNICEGKTGLGFIHLLQDFTKGGKDYMGMMPLKGKPLNSMTASVKQLMENKEFNELKQALGLREGVDYTDDENFKTLRYGKGLNVIADSDVDGYHIASLIFLHIKTRYPSLLQRANMGKGFYLTYMRTPIIKASKGTRSVKFYTQGEYNKWLAKTPNSHEWKFNYYKGLGSSSKDDVKEEAVAPRTVCCLYDDEADNYFDLAFHDKLADSRKDWIINHKYVDGVDDVEIQPLSHYIYYELVQYSIENVSRSIPRMLDGLKVSQRKAIHATLKYWKTITDSSKEIKLVILTSEILKMCYHHGEVNLQEMLISMTQTFTGSNNMPYYCETCNFGSREELGKDHSPARYVTSKPQWWLPYLFKKEDTNLLTPFIDEGEAYEPITYLPIVPLALINGATGIGSGFSTFIPNHNPLDVIKWLVHKIQGKPLPPVLPWYRGFKGEIKLIVRGRKSLVIPTDDVETVSLKSSKVKQEVESVETEEVNPNLENLNNLINYDKQSSIGKSGEGKGEEEVDDILRPEDMGEDEINVKEKISMLTIGKFTVREDGCVVVTELPIGRGMLAYFRWLEKLATEKVIKDFKKYGTSEIPYFEIWGFNNPTTKSLRLERSFGISNMVLLDIDNKPVKYETSQQLLEAFYEQRLPYYELRKQNIIQGIQDKINKISQKIKFVSAINSGQLIVLKRKKCDILKDMTKLSLLPDLLNTTNISHCTEEDIVEFNNKLEQLIILKTQYEQMNSSDLWLSDLQEFETEYIKRYNDVNEADISILNGDGKKTKGRKPRATTKKAPAKKVPAKRTVKKKV